MQLCDVLIGVGTRVAIDAVMFVIGSCASSACAYVLLCGFLLHACVHTCHAYMRADAQVCSCEACAQLYPVRVCSCVASFHVCVHTRALMLKKRARYVISANVQPSEIFGVVVSAHARVLQCMLLSYHSMQVRGQSVRLCCCVACFHARACVCLGAH